MSGIEVAYELKDKANYMMASQGPAFVGSWPYRHLLLQLFNNLNVGLRPEDLTDAPALLSRVKAEADPVSKYVRNHVRGKLNDEGKDWLDLHDDSRPPDEKTLKTLVERLQKLLNDRGLCEAEGVSALKMSGATRQVFARAQRRLSTANRQRLNRLLLADAYPGAISASPVTGGRHVKELFTKFFYSILNNSADFQLAGYSFDLCLCDLNKVGDLKTQVDELADALKAGLSGAPGLLVSGTVPLARELILLAHWDAQGFWQDSYTDLYDFCFRLRRRCQHIFAWKDEATVGAEPLKVLKRITKACGDMMAVLERGSKEQNLASNGEDERVIVRTSFAGAEYQYAHGLSIYFPWSEPADGFFNERDKDGGDVKPGRYRKEYRFSVETTWDEFLDEYFKKTRRESSRQEGSQPQPAGEPSAQDKTQAEILESLLRRIGTRVFTDGQLAKGSGNDAAGKGSGNDASGDCDCSSVKNYPSFTGSPEDEERPTGSDLYKGAS
jgi:hypothetical protein